MSKLIQEIKTDIEEFGQISFERRIYIIIHIGYNLFCDKDIGIEYIDCYTEFLRQLAIVFPPKNIIIYLPFIRGICQKQVTVQCLVAKTLQHLALRLGYNSRNLFEIVPVTHPPSQNQIAKLYEPETNRQGVLKAIHFSAQFVGQFVGRELEVILSNLIENGKWEHS